jgi:hypothetical protein
VKAWFAFKFNYMYRYGAGRVLGVSGAAHRALFAWSLARHHHAGLYNV